MKVSEYLEEVDETGRGEGSSTSKMAGGTGRGEGSSTPKMAGVTDRGEGSSTSNYQGNDVFSRGEGLTRMLNHDTPDVEGQGVISRGEGLTRRDHETPEVEGQGERNSVILNEPERASTCRDPERSRSRRHRSSDSYSDDGSRYRRRRRRSRHCRRRRDYSSSESDGLSPVPKRRRREANKETETNVILDKFLSILDKVGGSNKQKLTFNTNVIPEFDPLSKEQTVLTWLTKVEECAEIYGWDEKATIHYSLPKLSGVAKTWYQGLSTLLFSWPEWKQKLIESFPCREDYAELLTEMLGKKVKYGESLEQYYYAKINLLNRCKISGRQAVDCLLYGVEDRAVKVGAQAAQFKEPEQVLKYFRSVKVVQARSNNDTFAKRFSDRNSTPSTSRPGPVQSRFGSGGNSIKCFNCNEMGHPSFKCSKPLVKCTSCDRLGHISSNCFRSKPTNSKVDGQTTTKDNSIKDVSRVAVDRDDSIDKYILDIKINQNTVKCHVDLGSQCSLIRLSTAKALNLQINSRDDLPLLKGIGGNLTRPLGATIVNVDVQGLQEIIEIFVVEDYVLSHPVLLGHSFTERPDIVITKTPNEIIFQRLSQDRLHLLVERDTNISGNVLQPVGVTTNSEVDCNVYVNGSLRGTEEKQYYLFPGMYEIRNGHGILLVYNISPGDILVERGTLLTRAQPMHTTNQASTMNSFSLQISEPETSTVNCSQDLTEGQRVELQEVLARYKDCFSSGLKDLGFTNTTEMVIELDDNEPVVYRPYRMSYAERLLVRDMVTEMVDSGIVRESSSSYASPIVLVQKKTGEKRLCVDYRALNRKTKKEHYPLPRVEDQLDLLAGNTMFTSLDLASGYYQIPVSESSRDKTAFVTPDGQFEYNRMPFGLVNAPSVFQRTIHKILKEAQVKYAIVYMDDVLIPSKDFAQGIERLEEVLQLLKKGGLTLKLSKCNFFLDTIDFLGFEVSAHGIRPGSRKTDAVSKFREPTNQHELRQFLGLSGFFRRFIKDYAVITAPLTNLLKKDCCWVWNAEQQQAFTTVKQLLVDRPVLALYDPRAETELHTDASKEGLAGILLQRNSSGVLQPVSYFSRKTSADERKMHSFELETLAVIASLNRFRVYLVGIPFKILTDCNALRSTLVKRDLIARVARWWVQLQEYDCTIEYRPGARMSHADALSRNPVDIASSESHVLDVLQNIQTSEQDWIMTVQTADEEVRNIKSILSDSKSAEVADIHKNYQLKNDRVYRIVNDELKWLVPKTVRWQILKMNHDDVGHCGFDKTLQRIRNHYWFAKMRRFVKKYVTSCLECAHHKAPGGKREGELHPIEKVSTPFHTVHADHLGPFIKSKRGNCYLLVLVDGFTKFVNIFAVRNTKSITTIRAIKEHVSYFGVPTRLITDKGSSFTSKTFRDFTTSFGIKHVVNAVATPRANGQVERFNRTILDALATSSHGRDEKTWDEHIPDIQVGINTTKHKTTQKSPSELLFGFNITSRTEGILSSVINDTLNKTPVDELADIRQDASDKIREQQSKDLVYFNKRRKSSTKYREGDLVRVERQVPHDGKSQKLVVKYQGPYRVMKVLPNDRFLVEDTPMTRKNGRRYEAIISIDKMQPWMTFSRDFDSNESSHSATESE